MTTTPAFPTSEEIAEFYTLAEPSIGDLRFHMFPTTQTAGGFYMSDGAVQGMWKVTAIVRKNGEIRGLSLKRWRKEQWENVLDFHSADFGAITGWPLRLTLESIRTYIALSEERGPKAPDVTPRELEAFIDKKEIDDKMARMGLL